MYCPGPTCKMQQHLMALTSDTGFMTADRLDFGWWNCWVMIETCRRRTNAVFRSDTEVAASTRLQRGTRLCSRCLTVSCYLSCLRGRTANYVYLLDKWYAVFFGWNTVSQQLASIISSHKNWIVETPTTSVWALRANNLLFYFFLWTILTLEPDRLCQIWLKSRANHIHIIIIWRQKKIWPDGGHSGLSPPLATRLFAYIAHACGECVDGWPIDRLIGRGGEGYTKAVYQNIDWFRYTDPSVGRAYHL